MLVAALAGPALMLSRDARAFEGPGSSGGGDVLVAQFVSVADTLLADYPWPAEQRELLEAALRTSKISSASVLRDPATGALVPNAAALVAWSGPGFVELKQDSAAGGASLAALIRDRKPYAHLVAHELYRASGRLGPDGRSVDDRFQLSIGTYHLDGFPLLLAAAPGGDGGPAGLLAAVKGLVPGGHVLHCTDGSADAAEIVVAETMSGTTLLMRERTANGQTLGVLLSPDLVPGFQPRNDYMDVEAQLPAGSCRYAPTAADLLACSADAAAGAVVVTDGSSSIPLPAAELDLATAHVATETIDTLTQGLDFRVTLYDAAHPFPQGYTAHNVFDLRACAAQ